MSKQQHKTNDQIKVKTSFANYLVKDSYLLG